MWDDRRFVILSAVVLALACGALALACGGGGGVVGGRGVSFSADQVVTPGGTGRKIVSRCYFAPGKFRAEMKVSGMPGGALITIGRQDLGRAWIVFPGLKQYREISLKEMGADKVFFKPAPEQILEKLGTETVEGYRCEKMKVRTAVEGPNGTVESTRTVWVSKSFPVPLRTLSDSGNLTEYRHIEKGPQPAALFELPQGYTKMTGGMPFPVGR